MPAYATSTMIDVPVARPSRPSVRFTAFDIAITMKMNSRTAPTLVISRTSMSRMNEIVELATVSGSGPLLGKYSAMMPKVAPMIAWPTSFFLMLRPALFFLLTFR
jgi:hypothetical protein